MSKFKSFIKQNCERQKGSLQIVKSGLIVQMCCWAAAMATAAAIAAFKLHNITVIGKIHYVPAFAVIVLPLLNSNLRKTN